MEDYSEAFPEEALDVAEKPTYWPHGPEDQKDFLKNNPDAAH